jgi:hypothetical protein
MNAQLFRLLMCVLVAIASKFLDVLRRALLGCYLLHDYSDYGDKFKESIPWNQCLESLRVKN